ncbi:MAG: DUF3048 domain-containing protein [Actinobacteria bacterium]|nr:MAG: DUF3048 domain-containing protein [Actinomycetota bacterium]
MTHRNGTLTAMAAALLAALALGALPACKPAPAVVTSPWPVAMKERTAAKPPVPPRWPLTGLDAPDATAITRRVISVKIENNPAAKPQVGLDQADVVYESLAEGGITRFNAIFHSNQPAYLLGPVRSARLSDLDIVPQYGAMFSFAGANNVVYTKIRSAGLQELAENGGSTDCYERLKTRKAPHNLFIDLAKARTVGAAAKWPTTQTVRPFSFLRRSAEATPPVTIINIPFSDQAKAKWQYDPGTNLYLRWDRGTPHTDGETKKQLTARNVVVMWTKTTTTAKRDVAGSPTLDIELAGKGKATVFRDGVKIEGEWSAGADAPPEFHDADGTVIKLGTGNTWFQVIPTNQTITWQ